MMNNEYEEKLREIANSIRDTISNTTFDFSNKPVKLEYVEITIPMSSKGS